MEPRPTLDLVNEITIEPVPSITQAACGSGHSLERAPMHAKGYPASAAPIAMQDQQSILSAEAKYPVHFRDMAHGAREVVAGVMQEGIVGGWSASIRVRWFVRRFCSSVRLP